MFQVKLFEVDTNKLIDTFKCLSELRAFRVLKATKLKYLNEGKLTYGCVISEN